MKAVARTATLHVQSFNPPQMFQKRFILSEDLGQWLGGVDINWRACRSSLGMAGGFLLLFTLFLLFVVYLFLNIMRNIVVNN